MTTFWFFFSLQKSINQSTSQINLVDQRGSANYYLNYTNFTNIVYQKTFTINEEKQSSAFGHAYKR